MIYAGDPNLRDTPTECKECASKVRLSGQGFTEYFCKKCGIEVSHPNTSVPKLCIDCAKKYKLCRRCLVSIEE